MRNSVLIAINNIKLIFKRKSAVFSLIILPIIIFLVVASLYSGVDNSKIKVALVNNDSSILSSNMVKYLETTNKFQFINVTSNQINDLVTKRKVDCAILIPGDFEESILKGNFKDLKLVSIKGQDATEIIKNYANNYIKNLMDISKVAKGNSTEFYKIYTAYKNGDLKIKENKLKDTGKNKSVTYSSIGMLLMFILFSAGGVARRILDEKRENTYNRICQAPVSSKQYLLGNILANFSVIFFQVILLVLVLTKVLKIETFIPNLQLISILLIFGLAAIGLNMFIIAFSSSSTQASSLTTAITIPTCMLGGCFFEYDIMSAAMQRLGDFTPQKWAMVTIFKLMTGSEFSAIIINLVVLLVFAVTFFIIAAYKMNLGDKSNNFI
ncbi:MAG: ABC-type multidrug transport system, permease component [Clostridiaceae bacterium]|jgi:ABC-2 type transport system permease protein|nr:ABC-type multidrug transport system, permease component [Clostridiaceae bacterium]